MTRPHQQLFKILQERSHCCQTDNNPGYCQFQRKVTTFLHMSSVTQRNSDKILLRNLKFKASDIAEFSLPFNNNCMRITNAKIVWCLFKFVLIYLILSAISLWINYPVSPCVFVCKFQVLLN